MKKEPEIFLKHILECIALVESFNSGADKKRFIEDRMMQSAVIRQIEIIGEAAKNISRSFRERHPEIPWKEMIGTRDKMIHHYFGVDLDIAYGIMTKELPKLKKKITRILEVKR